MPTVLPAVGAPGPDPAAPAPPALPRKVGWLLLALTLVWGANWSLFPLAVREVSVWTFRGISCGVAGLLLLAWCRLTRHDLRIPRAQWPALLASTFFYLIVWNVAATLAAVQIPSGQAAVLGFTMPLWTALLGWVFLREPLGPRLRWGLLLGLLAVVLLVGRGAQSGDFALGGYALGLLAGLGWAIGTLLLKRSGIRAHPLVLTGWQMLLTALPLSAVALWQAEGDWFWPSATTLWVIGWITLVPTALGNAVWFALLRWLPATRAGLSSILVPVVAVLIGAVVRDEPLGWVEAIALAAAAMALWLALGGAGQREKAA